MSEDGGYVDSPAGDGTRVWAPAPKPKRKSRAKGAVPGQPPRPVLSDAERLERAAYQREKLEVRKRELLVQEALAGPALKAEGDPNVEHEHLIALDARTAAGRELVNVPRATAGSTLRVCARTYDGFRGGRPKFYALICTWFRQPGSGAPLRSKGAAIEGSELRPVALALLALADEYDAAIAAGTEPWAQPDSAWKPPEPAPVAPEVAAAPETDCPDCGGELPGGPGHQGSHLDGCTYESAPVPSPVPEALAVRPRKGARPYVVAVCYDAALNVAANMTREGHVAAIEGHDVRIGPLADGATADALAHRLARSNLPSHVEWASP